MPTTYERADESVEAIRDRMLAKYHGKLVESGVNVDLIVAYNPDGHAVTHGGYPAQAKIKIVGLKDRAAGRGDAEIIIDGDNWKDLASKDRDALMDHELEHLELKIDVETNKPVRDDLDRPKLKMVKHDFQLGWFMSVAERHGPASAEVKQAEDLWRAGKQLFFAFAVESAQPSPMRVAK